MKAYKYILKVPKFQLPTPHRFSTAERKPSLWADSTLPDLFRAKFKCQNEISEKILNTDFRNEITKNQLVTLAIFAMIHPQTTEIQPLRVVVDTCRDFCKVPL